MTGENKLFEDVAKLAGSAMGVATDLKREVEAMVTSAIERALRRADVVSRDEFEAMKQVALAAREAQEKLEARLAELEAKQK